VRPITTNQLADTHSLSDGGVDVRSVLSKRRAASIVAAALVRLIDRRIQRVAFFPDRQEQVIPSLLRLVELWLWPILLMGQAIKPNLGLRPEPAGRPGSQRQQLDTRVGPRLGRDFLERLHT
jgi:hypothetical protein